MISRYKMSIVRLNTQINEILRYRQQEPGTIGNGQHFWASQFQGQVDAQCFLEREL